METDEMKKQLSLDDYQRAGREVLRELSRHDLTPRQMKVALALLEFSLLDGRRSTRLPSVESLAQLSGLRISHVTEAVEALRLCRIVDVKESHGWREYTVQADTAVWKVRPFVARERMREVVLLIREANCELGGIKVEKEIPENFRAGTAAIKAAFYFPVGKLAGKPTGKQTDA
jgi:hypothetical protein